MSPWKDRKSAESGMSISSEESIAFRLSIPLDGPGSPFAGSETVDWHEPQTTLQMPPPAVVDVVQNFWYYAKRPTNVILVVDTSGSMEFAGVHQKTYSKLEYAARLAAALQFRSNGSCPTAKASTLRLTAPVPGGVALNGRRTLMDNRFYTPRTTLRQSPDQKRPPDSSR